MHSGAVNIPLAMLAVFGSAKLLAELLEPAPPETVNEILVGVQIDLRVLLLGSASAWKWKPPTSLYATVLFKFPSDLRRWASRLPESLLAGVKPPDHPRRSRRPCRC